MANVIEIVVQARNTASATLKDASTDVAKLRGVMAGLSPALAMTGGQLGGMAGSLSALAAGSIGMAGAVTIGGAAIVALGVGAFSAGKKLSDTVEQLDRMAARTGVGIENLQIMRRIIEEGGGDAEGLTTALSFLNRAIATQDPLLKQLNITTRDTFDAFLQLVTILAATHDDAKRTEITYQLLGRSAGALIPSFRELSTQIGPMGAKLRAVGAIVTEEMAPAARALDVQMDALSRNWSGAMTRMQAATIGPLGGIIQAFNDMWDSIRGYQKTPEELAARAISTLEREGLQLEKNAGDLRKLISDLESGKHLVTASPEYIPVYEKMLTNVETRLEVTRNRIKSLKAELGELPVTVAAPPSGDDLVARVQLAKEKAADERAKAIAKIAAAMGAGTAEATRFYAALTQLDAWKAGALGPENAEKVAQIAAAMKVGAGEAANLYAQLSQLDRMKMRDDIRKKVDELGWAMRSVADYTREAMGELVKVIGISGEVEEKWKGGVFQETIKGPTGAPLMPRGSAQERMSRELVKGAKPVEEPRPRALGKHEMRAEVAEAKRFMDDILSAASIAREGLQSVFAGLQSGFQGVLLQLTASWSASKNVLVQIITSLVNEVLAQLARLGASWVFRFLLGLIPGAGAVSVALGAVGAFAAQGGLVRGPGGPEEDRIPVSVSAGEYIVRAKAVKRPGVLPLLNLLNEGRASAAATVRSLAGPGLLMPSPASVRPTGLYAGTGMDRALEPARPREPAVHHTTNQKIIVQTFSPRDVIGQYASPAGAFRRATAQLARQTSY